MATSKLKVKATEANEVSNPNALKVAKPAEEGGGENPKEADLQKIKEDWNKYLEYLEEKGVKGSPELDKGGLGNKYFQEYIKANPETSLSPAVIPKIREAYTELRNVTMEQIKSGKGGFKDSKGKIQSGPNTDFTDYMKSIVENEKTKDPNYVGQKLTQTKFPAMLDESGKVAVPLYKPGQTLNYRKAVDSAAVNKKVVNP
jgi:hypothetical protein